MYYFTSYDSRAGFNRLADLVLRQRVLERICLSLGLSLLAIYFGARIDGAVLSRLAVQSFEQPASWYAISQNPARGPSSSRLDFSLWSQPRIAAYEQSLNRHFLPPLAVLRVRSIDLEVPVLDGTDDLTLNRGTGWILGTARPGALGNIGIAGHRDGFFRGLKNLRVNDTMELVTSDRTDTYSVDDIRIVNPDDVSVLRPTATPSLTLVTCYPFYFVGSAPQRYIVHASIRRSPSLRTDADTKGSSATRTSRTRRLQQ
jgi:sortase A